jgi:hypothetical protein
LFRRSCSRLGIAWREHERRQHSRGESRYRETCEGYFAVPAERGSARVHGECAKAKYRRRNSIRRKLAYQTPS